MEYIKKRNSRKKRLRLRLDMLLLLLFVYCLHFSWFEMKLIKFSLSYCETVEQKKSFVHVISSTDSIVLRTQFIGRAFLYVVYL